MKDHLRICPAKLELRQRIELQQGMWLPVQLGPAPEQPQGWWIATDGSGGSTTGDRAGWGVVIFRYSRWEELSDVPDYILHGPVLTADWDHRWLGAREETNNTAELTAIGEAMMWLYNEAPDDGTVPAIVRYDSQYAANLAQGIWDPKSNEELAYAVRELVIKVTKKRAIEWRHVYGHQGHHDNELADRAAALGSQGLVSEVLRRWAAPPPEIVAAAHDATDFCKKCGVEVMARDIVWHTVRCEAVGFVIPQGWSKCRKCKALIKARHSHETLCRGSELANRTCRKFS